MRYLMLILSLWIGVSTAAFAVTPKGLCKLLAKHPQWYADARHTQHKWGVPVATQFAIISLESDFDAHLTNAHSTAYGFSQALNHTWALYQKDQHSSASRSNFAAATDFIGWYAKQMDYELHIKPTDTYHLYLTYHDGSGGYGHDKHGLGAHLASHVAHQAAEFAAVLSKCQLHGAGASGMIADGVFQALMRQVLLPQLYQS